MRTSAAGEDAGQIGSRESTLVCFSHLRWDFVYQRPQHLMSRFAQQGRVLFVEEPIFSEGPAEVSQRKVAPNVSVVLARLPHGTDAEEVDAFQRAMLDDLIEQGVGGGPLTTWYYTPIALSFSDHLVPDLCVYDCMDELSGFLGAPPRLHALEAELFARADLVFTGGRSLFEAKKGHHPNIHAFPSSIDKAHFMLARRGDIAPPLDQADLTGPRIGFFGVVDERMDMELVAALADANPDLQFVILGPVVKIDAARIPQRANLHWLGRKAYSELPDYLAGWDAGFMPFALNNATRYISPTKTPEFLAAGVPVVSSPVPDVVVPYGENGLVEIGGDIEDWSMKLRAAIARRGDAAWRHAVDTFLADLSWDDTFERMSSLMQRCRGFKETRGSISMPQEQHVNV